MVSPDEFIPSDKAEEIEHWNSAAADFNEQGMRLQSMSTKKVETAADAMAKAGLDPAYWRVKSAVPGKWTVPVKRKAADGSNTIEEVECWKISVQCVPRMPESAYAATNLLMDRLRKIKVQFPQVRSRKVKTGDCMLEVSIADIHAGKLACSGGWSLREFEKVYLKTVNYFIDRCSGHSIAEIVIPVGNDMLNVDTDANTTTAGTPQRARVTHKEMYASAQWALISAVERCRHIADVKIIHVPGNHDWSSSEHLCQMLDAVFRNDPHVTVDLDMEDLYGGGRKYHANGNVLIGYAHGNNENPKEYPGIMSTEVPRLWADSTCREFHIGHKHFRHARKKIQSTLTEVPYHEHHGVLVRQLPSISPSDHWHKRKGYVGSQRMNEAFLYDLEWGIEDVLSLPYERVMQ